MLFAVRYGHGPSWDDERPLRDQDGWNTHAAFMDALVDDGTVLLGGTLGDPIDGALVIADEGGADALRDRLVADPWVEMGLLTLASVEPWTVLLGDASALTG
jgi:uncharacterized protein YciI